MYRMVYIDMENNWKTCRFKEVIHEHHYIVLRKEKFGMPCCVDVQEIKKKLQKQWTIKMNNFFKNHALNADNQTAFHFKLKNCKIIYKSCN